jgi:hypothetical protein
MGWECNIHGEKRNGYIYSFVGKIRKRVVGRPTPRWEDNIKIEVRKQAGVL